MDDPAYDRLAHLRELREHGGPARYFEFTGPGGVPGVPGAVEAWVVEDLGDGIVARYRLEPRRGSLVVVALEVTAEADAPGVTARALRRLSPALAVRAGMRALGSLDAGMSTIGWGPRRIMDATGSSEHWSDSALWRRIATPDGIAQLSRPERLAVYALAYVEALQDGPKVNAAIAKRFGMTVAQSRERIREARRAGLLTYPPALAGKRRGRIGGALTPKAEELREAIERTWQADPPVVTVPRTGEPGLFDTYQAPEPEEPG